MNFVIKEPYLIRFNALLFSNFHNLQHLLNRISEYWVQKRGLAPVLELQRAPLTNADLRSLPRDNHDLAHTPSW